MDAFPGVPIQTVARGWLPATQVPTGRTVLRSDWRDRLRRNLTRRSTAPWEPIDRPETRRLAAGVAVVHPETGEVLILMEPETIDALAGCRYVSPFVPKDQR